jgi:glutamate 5-kinase
MGKRIVVKIGSQVLCEPGGALNRDVLANLVRQLGALSTGGWQILLVTSGAVAAGASLAGERIQGISDPVARKQVMAATGQVQ